MEHIIVIIYALFTVNTAPETPSTPNDEPTIVETTSTEGCIRREIQQIRQNL